MVQVQSGQAQPRKGKAGDPQPSGSGKHMFARVDAGIRVLYSCRQGEVDKNSLWRLVCLVTALLGRHGALEVRLWCPGVSCGYLVASKSNCPGAKRPHCKMTCGLTCPTELWKVQVPRALPPVPGPRGPSARLLISKVHVIHAKSFRSPMLFSHSHQDTPACAP